MDYSSVPAEQDTFPGSKIEGISKQVCVPLHASQTSCWFSAHLSQNCCKQHIPQCARRYALVVEAMNHSSWDELLEIRSSVFLMKEEEGAAAAVATAASARSGDIGAAGSVATVAHDVAPSISAPSFSSPNAPGAIEQPAAAGCSAASKTVSVDGSSTAAADAIATVSNDSPEANAEQAAEAGKISGGEESDSDIWRADLALGVAKMVPVIAMTALFSFALLHLLPHLVPHASHCSSSLAQGTIVPQRILMHRTASSFPLLIYKLCFRQTRTCHHQNSSA